MMISFAPTRWLTLAAAISFLLLVAVYLVATRQPWLGVEFKPAPSGSGVMVSQIDMHSPNTGLIVGDTVVALSKGVHTETLGNLTLYVEVIPARTFAELNRFYVHHRAIWEIIVSGEFEFVLADGRRVAGHTVGLRPGTDLSWRFWYLTTLGSITFLIGVGVWAFQPRQISTRLVLIGTTGYLYATFLTALIHSCELTLSPQWIWICVGVNNIGVEIISYSLLALLWYYPRPLSRFPAATFCGLLALVIVTNEMLQVIDLPGQTFLVQFVIVLVGMIILAVTQWRRTQSSAIERASLKWFLLTIIVSAGCVVALYFLPLVYGGESIMSEAMAYTTGMFIYLGFAFGIARYRLFDIESWWMEVWLWLAGGLLVVAIDAALMTTLQVTNLLALGLAIILAGWAYFPLRQWLSRRLLRSTHARIDDHFPLLVETLFRDGAHNSFGDRWRDLLQRVFAPAEVSARAVPVTQAALAEAGIALHVPSFDGNEIHALRFREQGQRLYSLHDVALADTLLSLTRRVAVLWRAREETAHAERTRIMRDLHDDVAGKLLTLAHRVKDPAQSILAREALTSLRQVIYQLDKQKPLALADFLTELQVQLRERARDHGIEVDWQEPATLPTLHLESLVQTNLQRVLSEAASNAIRHCAPTRISVSVWIANHDFKLQFCNDGTIAHKGDWKNGQGINNIHNRMRELNGEANWSVTHTNDDEKKRTCCLELRLPLPAEQSV